MSYNHHNDNHRFMAITQISLCLPAPPVKSRYQKVKPIWILLKQETVSGSGISWAIYKSAPRSRQITTPTPHHSIFVGANFSSTMLSGLSLYLFEMS